VQLLMPVAARGVDPVIGTIEGNGEDVSSPAAKRRIERQARIVAAHPRWHGVHADRIYFDLQDERQAWLAYYATLNRALEDLARSEAVYAKLSARRSRK
jgi:hypothetical protein